MTATAEWSLTQSPQTVGVLQAWESQNIYPEETPFVSKPAWAYQPKSRGAPGWLRGITISDVTPTIGLWAASLPNEMGRQWVPWSFVSAAGEIGSAVVSVSGISATSSNVILANATAGRAGTTTILPITGVSNLIYPGQITATTLTSLWHEPHEILLLTPGLLPRTLRVREKFWEDYGPWVSDPRLADALAAFQDLGRWLNRSQDELVEICRISLRAFRYWTSGKTKSPRSDSVRRLHEVHAFVGSLVRTLGRQRTRDWLEQPDAAGVPRLHVLATEDGVTTLVREASPWLFAEAPRPEPPRPELTEAAEAEATTEPYEPSLFHGPIRRPRRAPRTGE